MAITIADYSYRQLITGDAPASSLSGFVVLITEANVDSTFWDNVDNGGGDVRVSINSDGTSQLPLEIILCNTTTDKLIAWVRFPTYSTSARELYVFSGNTGQTQPAATDTFGSQAAWQDYRFVSHDGGGTDSTGNFTLTPDGTVVAGDAIGKIGSATAFNSYRSFNSDAVIMRTLSTNFHLSMWFQSSNLGQNKALWQAADSDTRVLRLDQNKIFYAPYGAGGGKTEYLSSPDITADTWYYATATREFNVQARLIVNGVSQGVSAGSNASTITIGPEEIGAGISGLIDEIFVYDGQPAEPLLLDQVAYSNQSNPANFWTQSTPDDPSGGGGGIALIPVIMNHLRNQGIA